VSRASKWVFWRSKGTLNDDFLHFAPAFVNFVHAQIANPSSATAIPR